MEISVVQEILRTREQIAKKNGNPTELSLIAELLKISEEHKRMKEQDGKDAYITKE